MAEIQKQRGDLAAQIREQVVLAVLDFDVLKKDFQVSQEIARREVARAKLREVDYRFSLTVSTNAYLRELSGLDQTKVTAYRQWARLRAQLARIKLLVLGAGE